MNFRQLRHGFVGLVIVSLSATSAFADYGYTFVDLGTLGGSGSFGQSVNNSGQVAGYSANQKNQDHAFYYDQATNSMKDLGTLGGSRSQAYGINSSGQVTGFAYTSSNTDAVLSAPKGGAYKDLGTLGGNIAEGYALNDSGQVTGYSRITGNLVTHAFISTPNGGALRDLGTLGGNNSIGEAINSSGQVAGYSDVVGGVGHAFVTDPNGGAMRDIGVLPNWTGSSAWGINNAGVVIGNLGRYNGSTPQTQAFIYSPGTSLITSIGTLGGLDSEGYGINNSGQGVGTSLIGDGSEHAFLYRPPTYTNPGTMLDLNSLVSLPVGITLDTAYGISDTGFITGFAYNSVTNQATAFLLIPTSVSVPEPSAYLLILIGGAVLGLKSRRKLRANHSTDRAATEESNSTPVKSHTVAILRMLLIFLSLSSWAGNRARADYSFLSQIGSPGSGDGQLNFPNGVAVDGAGDVFVADRGNNRINEYSSNGSFLRTINAGSGQIALSSPQGLALDGAGNLYVADSGNQRVVEFSNTGSFIQAFSTSTFYDGPSSNPISLAVDASGNVFAADLRNNTVKEFSHSGAFDPANQPFFHFGSNSLSSMTVFGVALDSQGHLFVLNLVSSFQSGFGINEYSSTGTLIRAFGSYGTALGQLNSPSSLATDMFGDIFVTDQNRVQEFSPAGAFITSFGVSGSGDGQLNNPFGLAVDNSGNVYVADRKNNRVEVFAPTVPEPGSYVLLGLGLALMRGYSTRVRRGS